MRKVLILLLLAIFVMPSRAQNLYEIEKIIKEIPDNDPVAFWQTLKRDLKENKEMLKAIDKRKKSMDEALGRLPDFSVYPEYVKSRAVDTEDAEQIIKTIEEVTHIHEALPLVNFYVVKDDNHPDAGMYPDGTCEINSYWLHSNNPIEELIAVSCHEIGHFICNHRIRDTWNVVKAEKRNKILAEIGTGLTMGAYAGSQIYAAQYGAAQSYQAQQQMYNNLATVGRNAVYEGEWYANYRQRFMYFRNSETEADEIAFWFMEKNGIDPIHLINLFKKLAAEPQIELTKQMKKVMDHPEWDKRIKHIKKLYKKHHKPNMKENQVLAAYNKITREQSEKVPGTVYMDKSGMLHAKSSCQGLKYSKLDYETNKDKLTEEPKFCKHCFSDKEITDLMIEITSKQISFP